MLSRLTRRAPLHVAHVAGRDAKLLDGLRETSSGLVLPVRQVVEARLLQPRQRSHGIPALDHRGAIVSRAHKASGGVGHGSEAVAGHRLAVAAPEAARRLRRDAARGRRRIRRACRDRGGRTAPCSTRRASSSAAWCLCIGA